MSNYKLTIIIYDIPSNTPSASTLWLTGEASHQPGVEQHHQFTCQANGNYELTLESATPCQWHFHISRGNVTSIERDIKGEALPARQVNHQQQAQRVAIKVSSWADLPFQALNSHSGNIIIHPNMAMPQIDRSRSVRVYLPPNYDSCNEPCAVLYMYDGQNLFDRFITFADAEWCIDETLESRYYAGIEDNLVVVGIDNSFDRGCEYNPFENDIHPLAATKAAYGNRFNAFIVDNVKPFIDRSYRVKSDRTHTYIGGSSMGAHMAMKMALDYQSTFSKVIAMSPSYQNQLHQPFNLPSYIASTEITETLNIYQDMGTAEQVRNITATTLIENMETMHNALLKAGIPPSNLSKVIAQNADHTETAWAKRFPSVLDWLANY